MEKASFAPQLVQVFVLADDVTATSFKVSQILYYHMNNNVSVCLKMGESAPLFFFPRLILRCAPANRTIFWPASSVRMLKSPVSYSSLASHAILKYRHGRCRH